MSPSPGRDVEIELTAAIVALDEDTPLILALTGPATRDGLPSGRFDPHRHRTMEVALRAFVEAQTALRLGYVEQLYTFGDRGRHLAPRDTGPHVVSVGYLALTRLPEPEVPPPAGAEWRPWYGYFPWEDFRGGRPAVLDETILPALAAWAGTRPGRAEPNRPLGRPERVRLAFGTEGMPFDEEKALDRYELLYEAGLVGEAAADGREAALARGALPPLGLPMRFDHRRILATAISRLRAKLKYRPVVFELMPPEFTLTDLQRVVEATSGRHLHKQNFRRLVEAGELVEPTGRFSPRTGGRPAQLHRFRREVVEERPSSRFRLGQRS